MIEASFWGFIKTIAIIFLCYQLFKLLIRIFAPILMRKAISKVQQKMENQFNQQETQHQSATQNTTKSKVNPKEKKKIGEYIDYEEVD